MDVPGVGVAVDPALSCIASNLAGCSMSDPIVPAAIPPQSPGVPVPVLSYAAPGFGAQAVRGAWRDGPTVVVYQSAELPDACVKCGGPPERRLKRKLAWHPPIVYVGLLGGILPFAIMAMVMQKKVTVMVPMCGEHLQKRKRALLIAWTLSVGGLAVAIGGPMVARPELLIPLGIILFIVGIIFGVRTTNPLQPKKIELPYAYLKGACEMFLQQLPDLRQPPAAPN